MYTSDDTLRMIAEAELVKGLLNYCAVKYGAKIIITVEHDDGHKAIANLYDDAAFVQALYDALIDFQRDNGGE